MVEIGKTQAASSDEDTKIGETQAIFVNKLYFTALPLGGKITFAEQFRVGNVDVVEPRTAIFLQHQDVLALHQLLGSALKKVKVQKVSSLESTTDG